ncbi:hypothetical protein PR001_g25953 [Phytophthora rubi]|uniref:Uncharacterized protein n=1 Tax=Phytophthora rubi TaxID=129364 RepID=A0A6A3I0N6_9STRA|nr:hypothetical protein PR001_g25953 [Phytophthora rubi]
MRYSGGAAGLCERCLIEGTVRSTSAATLAALVMLLAGPEAFKYFLPNPFLSPECGKVHFKKPERLMWRSKIREIRDRSRLAGVVEPWNAGLQALGNWRERGPAVPAQIKMSGRDWSDLDLEPRSGSDLIPWIWIQIRHCGSGDYDTPKAWVTPWWR